MLRRGNLRDIFDGYALSGVGFDIVLVLRQFGQLDIPDETVIHRYPLSSAFAYAFRLIHVDVVDQLLKQWACEYMYELKDTSLRCRFCSTTESIYIGRASF